MKVMSKSLAALAVTAILGTTVAHAVTVSFGGVSALDGSGMTSVYKDPTQTAILDGYFIETFDAATGYGLGAQTSSSTNPYVVINPNQGCAINTLAVAGALTVDGSFGVRKNTLNGVAAAPAGDTTCFGFGPGPSPAPRASGPDGYIAKIKVDYSGLGFLNPGDSINYLGLYYGSIDTYNDIAFYSGTTLITGGGGLLDDGVISGAEILASQGGSTGNQFASGSNVYVNLVFGAGEEFTAFEFRTKGVAFEVDNIVTGLTSRNDVPEPGSLALLGLGLAGLAASRRRKAV